jgi:hypothetical protein
MEKNYFPMEIIFFQSAKVLCSSAKDITIMEIIQCKVELEFFRKEIDYLH